MLGEERVEDICLLGLFQLQVIEAIQTNSGEKERIALAHVLRKKGCFQTWLEQGV